ncbi:unnamed protein product [Camellia sinensis]
MRSTNNNALDTISAAATAIALVGTQASGRGRNRIQELKQQCMMLECTSHPSVVCVDEMAMESVNDPKPDLDELIYLIGGYNGVLWLSALDSYSPTTDVIKSVKPMNHGRAYVSIASLNGELYGSLAGATLNNVIFAMGGANGVDCYADVEMFDLDVGRWISSCSMLQKRFACAAVELNGAIYAVGGYDGKEYLKVQKRLLEFILAAFHRPPNFVALLKMFTYQRKERRRSRYDKLNERRPLEKFSFGATIKALS